MKYRQIIILLILLLLVLTLYTISAHAEEGDIPIFELNLMVESKCDHPACLEGTNVTFYAYFYNNFGTDLKLNSIYLYGQNKPAKPFVVYEFEDPVFLNPQEDYEVNITKTLWAPEDNSYTFYYLPCVNVSIYKTESKYIISKYKEGLICRSDLQSVTTVPLSKIECWNDSECKEDEVCKMYLYKCRKPRCPVGFVKDRKCVDFTSYLVALGVILIFVLVFFITKKQKIIKTKRKKGKKEK